MDLSPLSWNSGQNEFASCVNLLAHAKKRISWNRFLEEDPRQRWSLCLYRGLSRGQKEWRWRRCGRKRRWKERARTKSGGWRDAAGVPRARGKCTVVDVNPPTSRRPAWVLSVPVGPHYGPLRTRRAIASVQGTAQRDLAVSLHWTIQWAIASFASHQDDRVVEKFHGKGWRNAWKKERPKKTSERSATKRTPTYRLESDCSHRAASPRRFGPI